jgi:hypothetical protein
VYGRAVSNGAGSFSDATVEVDASEAACTARRRGFSIGCDGAGPLGCVDVRGFRDAIRAAADPHVAAPQRFVIIGPDARAASWLDAWAEDVARVRRNIVVSRRFDGEEVIAIVTIAAHGYGIQTSLAIESLRATRGGSSDDIFRSGVHLKADLEALLADRTT